MLEMSKDGSSLRASEAKTEFLPPALLSYVLQTSPLILFGREKKGKPFCRAAGAQMLQLCQPMSMHCRLCHEESLSPLPTSASAQE